jgi:hypothetical protein
VGVYLLPLPSCNTSPAGAKPACLLSETLQQMADQKQFRRFFFTKKVNFK